MADQYGFVLVAERQIAEINSQARLYEHTHSGARLLSICNEDENKVFGITFRTPPSDSTGVPHIMEHAVLCGSVKYPVKEPFVELLKGSLNTFLNAFTMPDRTCYPVASTNQQDFYHLVDVYLDAVFNPLLTEQTLQQEGWHYELESVDAPLTYKGVVFNEMKGAYSSPEELLGRYSRRSLFPDTIYRHDAGGDPREIPNLSFEQFIRFHQTYYHPSNAYIYFYGDDPEEERLRLLSNYLEGYDRVAVDLAESRQPVFSEPASVQFSYDTGGDEEKEKTYLTVNWMLPGDQDVETMLGLEILAHILLGTPASPLRKVLLESGLGEDLTGSGLDDNLLQLVFSAGMKGVLPENLARVEALILETLKEQAEQGINPDTVAASLNTIEFALRENNTGAYPRGLVVMLRALRDWIYHNDPFSPLAFETPLKHIKERVAAGEPYFENLIRTHILENTHRVKVVLEPDSQLGARLEAEEGQRLEEIRSTKTEAELQSILAAGEGLRKRQETPDSPEALATIPRLELEDLEKQVRTIPLEVSETNGVRLLHHDLFTNGILYLDLAFDLRSLSQHLIPYLPLFGRALVEIGTHKEDYVQISQRIGRLTGGIGAGRILSPTIDPGGFSTWFTLRGKATLEHTQDLLDILSDLLLTVRLDNQSRFKQMALEAKARLEAGLVPGGHRVVNNRLRAAFHLVDYLAEITGGVSYLEFLRRLIERIDTDWEGVLADLETIRVKLLNREAMLVNATLESDGWRQVKPRLEAFLEALPGQEFVPVHWQMDQMTGHEGLVIPAQVNFVGKGSNLKQMGDELDGSLLVVNKYIQTTWLWEKIRVQGGAYGGFSVLDQLTGTFSFVSYRDPNLNSTLDYYDATPDYLRRLDLSRDELTRAIIGVISDLDAYLLPDAKGYTSLLRYLSGKSDEHRQKIRDQVLGTTQADFKRAADILDEVTRHGRVVVMGSQKAIEQANQSPPGWLRLYKVL
jgi:Zn-dependent M16 (insulinase) family peptidase